MKPLAWLGATFATGVIIWLMAMGVLLPIEMGRHQRAAFVPGGQASAWIAIPIVLTVVAGVIWAAVFSRDDL